MLVLGVKEPRKTLLITFFTSEDNLVEEHMKLIEKQGLFKENLGQQLESIINFFCSIDAWGFDFQKVLGLFVVPLMHGETTCWSFYTICGYVDVWGQQLTNFTTFVIVLMCASFQCWLVSCGYVNVYKYLFYVIVLIWGKTNKDVSVLVAWMTPRKPHY